MGEMQKADQGNLLIPVTEIANPYDQEFNDVATGGKFWPRLQLFGSNSDAVKEGKIEVGYGIIQSKDQIIPIGKQVDILVMSWRPLAMNVKEDPIISTHDPKSTLFQQIKADADVQDSGAMFGPEYAVYVPEAECYCTLFMGSKSTRREAPKIKALIGRAATLKVVLLSNSKFKWHSIQCVPCSTPFNIPSVDEIKAKIAEFLNPPTDNVEEVKPVEATRDR